MRKPIHVAVSAAWFAAMLATGSLSGNTMQAPAGARQPPAASKPIQWRVNVGPVSFTYEANVEQGLAVQQLLGRAIKDQDVLTKSGRKEFLDRYAREREAHPELSHIKVACLQFKMPGAAAAKREPSPPPGQPGGLIDRMAAGAGGGRPTGQTVDKKPDADSFDVTLASAPVSIRPDPDKAYELLYRKVSNEVPARVMVKVGTLAGAKASVMEPGEEIELATPEGRFSVQIQKLLLDKAVSLGFIKGGDNLFVALFEVVPGKGGAHTFGRQVSNVVAYGPNGTIIGKADRSPSGREAAEKNGKLLIAEVRSRAERGDPKAQWALGDMYNTGLGVTSDRKKAVEWWRKAAAQGYPEAQFKLAGAYLLGQGIKKNHKDAAAWYLKAAAQGHAGAQYAIGSMYIAGSGVPMDDAKGVASIRQAAEQGLVDAQFMLGDLHDGGKFAPKDPAQAVAWYTKAAEQGHVTAMFRLALKDNSGGDAKSYMWVSLAAMYASGDEKKAYSLVRDKLAEELQPAILATGKDLMRDWIAAYELRKKK